MKTNWTKRLGRGLALLLVALAATATVSCKRQTAAAEADALSAAQRADSLALVAAEARADSLAAAEEAMRAAAEAARAEELARADEAARAAEEALALAVASLTPVYFDFDKADLKTEARAALSRHAETLREHAGLRVRLEGHCDENGSVDYNLALGDRRAEAVRSYLVNLGLDAGRFETISWGKSRPAVLGHGEEAWSRNRRCEFTVVR